MPDFYGSASGFRSYHISRANDFPDLPDADIEAALLVSSEWIDNRFRLNFGGYKVLEREQLREWPRIGHYDSYGYLVPSSEVPREILSATYEMALRRLDDPAQLSIDFTPNKYKSVSVSGAVAVQYAAFTSASQVQKEFAIVGEILSGLLYYYSQSSSLSGAVNRI